MAGVPDCWRESDDELDWCANCQERSELCKNEGYYGNRRLRQNAKERIVRLTRAIQRVEVAGG